MAREKSNFKFCFQILKEERLLFNIILMTMSSFSDIARQKYKNYINKSYYYVIKWLPSQQRIL